MRLTRREAIGTAIGGAAAVAMPDVAGSALPPPTAPPPYWGENAAAKEVSQRQYEAEQLAKLRRIAAGDIYEHEKNYPEYGPVEPYDALRSVSPAAKRLMLKDFHARQWRERTIERAKQALAEYDKTGLLKHVL
jgi:hypothetical protein